MSENKTWEYKVEDIFEDIPDDPENVIMNIPQEVREAVGLVEGDILKILIGDKGTLILEKVDNKKE